MTTDSTMTVDHAAFIRAQTRPLAPPLVPEILLHLADEVTPLWQATEATMDREGLPPPYWAFAWPGGQAVARHLLDRPELAQGKRVLDFAAGSGLSGLAALRAGAASAISIDIDPFAAAAIRLNAELNELPLSVDQNDWLGRPASGFDLVIAGDVCYERPMAERATRWLAGLAAAGAVVLIGDPGRAYLPGKGLEPLGRYAVPTPLDLEDRTMRETIVYRLTAEAALP